MDRWVGSYFRVAWLIFVAMTILFLDFVSKAYIYYLFPEIDPGIWVFRDFLGIDFSISLALNKGAAWGMFAGYQNLLLVVRICVCFALLTYLFFFNRNPLVSFPLVLILAGATGNIIDFFLYGLVVDFLKFNLWGYNFPVFNIADSAITIGVFWLIIISSFSKKSPSYNA